MADGEIVTLRGRIVRPLYADDGSLDQCEYRGILTVLMRRLQVCTAQAWRLMQHRSVSSISVWQAAISMCMPEAWPLIIFTVHRYAVRGGVHCAGSLGV